MDLRLIQEEFDYQLSPLAAAQLFAAEDNLCLLHSAATATGIRFSIVAAAPTHVITATAAEWSQVRSTVRESIRTSMTVRPPFTSGWMGWISYDTGAGWYGVKQAPTRWPAVMLGWYDWAMVWDHVESRAWLAATGLAHDGGDGDPQRAADRAAWIKRHLVRVPHPTQAMQHRDTAPPIATISAAEYQARVRRVIEYILDGEIFQANISQQFRTDHRADPARLMSDISRRSAASMAGWIRHGEFNVVSASPERLLRYDARQREASSSPIKGTRRRSSDPQSDALSAQALVESPKDRAENVMIVDLVRNDLSRVCMPGSVRVTDLCRVESLSTVHHLVSTVTGMLAPNRDVIDLFEAIFPAGSISGAPKQRAIELIAKIEQEPRGVYAGALGWIGADGSCDLGIPIRTALIDASGTSMRAGGGITARSNPSDEYQESCDKASALLDAIGRAG